MPRPIGIDLGTTFSAIAKDKLFPTLRGQLDPLKERWEPIIR
jgi:hypothetical protein